MNPGRLRIPLSAALACALLLAGCAPGPADRSGYLTESLEDTAPTKTRPGSSVVGLEFLYAYENEPAEAYFPIEGIAGCVFSPEGTLIFCDEKRGKVYGRDTGTWQWYEFDSPMSSLYRPTDVQVDGFKVLVLDMGGNNIYRFNLSGAYHDRLLDIRQVDPVFEPLASAFAVDRDGRLFIADVAQQQVLMLDSFLNLTMRVGDPGSHDDQFSDPSGILFLLDGSFLVSDRGNRRLTLYGQMGFFDQEIGGDFDPRNPFVAPQGLALDRQGNVFVADQGNGLIHVLNRRLKLQFSAGPEFGVRGLPLGPVDVAVGPDDLLAVSDRARNALLVYRIIYE